MHPALPHAETDGKVVRTLVKLTLFRQFYIMVRWLHFCGKKFGMD